MLVIILQQTRNLKKQKNVTSSQNDVNIPHKWFENSTVH